MVGAKEKRSLAVSPAAVVIGLAVVAGIAIFLWLTFSPRPVEQPKPILTPEARAYLPNLKLSDIEPQTSESYIQKSLFEIMGKLTNSGPKTVRAVRVTCVFHNYGGKEIKRELVSVADPRTGALPPNATKSFRLAFDDIPDDWDHQMPNFVIAQIVFD